MWRLTAGCIAFALLVAAPTFGKEKRTFDWFSGRTSPPPVGDGALLSQWFADCDSLSGDPDGLARARCEGRREAVRAEARGQIYMAYSPLDSLTHGPYNARKKLFRVKWTGHLGDVPFDAASTCTRLDQVSAEQRDFPYWPPLTTPLSSFFCGDLTADDAAAQEADPALVAAQKRIANGHVALVRGKARRWPSLRGRQFSVRVRDAAQAERLMSQGTLTLQSVVRVLRPLEGWARCCGGKPAPLKRGPAADGSLSHIQGLRVQVLAFRLIDLTTGAIFYSKPESVADRAVIGGGGTAREGEDPTVDPGQGPDEEAAGNRDAPEDGVTRAARLVEEPNISLPPGAEEPTSPVTVVVEVVVGVEGDVEEVTLAHGRGEPWDSHAEELALDLRYEPALDRGRPVQARTTWEVVFGP